MLQILSSFYQTKNDARDRQYIVRITCVAFLITLALSWRLYIRELRIFSISPVMHFLGQVPLQADWILYALNIAFLLWLLIRPLDRIAAIGTLSLAAFWILQDLLRFQPYNYMYIFTLLFAVMFKEQGLRALRIMVGSVYFWAGFHKMNDTFYEQVFPHFISPLYVFSKEPSFLNTAMQTFVVSAPVFELAIGILLLFFPRQTRLASAMALTMLIVVLLCLGPFGNDWNKIVWPWNIYLFLIELILFLKVPQTTNPLFSRLSAPAIVSIALFTLAPALALVGWWHSYPAFKLYSGNVEAAQIMFPPNKDLSHLPNGIGKLVTPDHALDLVAWTEHEFNTIVYPETFVFRHGAKGLCRYLDNPRDVTLRIFQPAPFDSLMRDYKDYPVCT